MNNVILSTAYLPNLNYFSYLVNCPNTLIDQYEYFEKQTYRNRCDILTAQGKLSLSIPLQKQAHKELIKDKKISYAENWQHQHWRAIYSAYKNSPYFDFFEDDLRPLYTKQYDFLLDYNTTLLTTITTILRLPITINYSDTYIEPIDNLYDLRNTIHPKQPPTNTFNSMPYYQVFDTKFGFTPNLSIIDLLFNKGLESVDIIKQSLLHSS